MLVASFMCRQHIKYHTYRNTESHGEIILLDGDPWINLKPPLHIGRPHFIETHFSADRRTVRIQRGVAIRLKAGDGKVCTTINSGSCRYSVSSDLAYYPCVVPVALPWDCRTFFPCRSHFGTMHAIASGFSQIHGEFLLASDACLRHPFPNKAGLWNFFISISWEKFCVRNLHKSNKTYKRRAFNANQSSLSKTHQK